MKEIPKYSWLNERSPEEILGSHSDENIIVYDADIARASSIEEAIILRRFYFFWRKFKQADGWFFLTPKTFSEPIAISFYAFQGTMHSWEKLGILETVFKGQPGRKWYRPNLIELANRVVTLQKKGQGTENSNLETQPNETSRLGCRNQQASLLKAAGSTSKSNSKSNKNTVVAAQSADDRVGFGLKKKTPIEKVWAAKLHAGVCQARQNQPIMKPDQWHKDLHQLLIQSNNDPKRITKVLDWYISHIKDEYVPEAYSGRAFRKKFDQIESTMEKSSTGISDANELNAKLEGLISELKESNWPNNSESAVPSVVNQSFSNYTKFYDAWLAWRRSLPNKDFRVVSDLVEGISPDGWSGSENEQIASVDTSLVSHGWIKAPEAFVKKWMSAVNDEIINWKDWRGTLKKYVWAIDHPLYAKHCQIALSDHGLSDNSFDTYIQFITK